MSGRIVAFERGLGIHFHWEGCDSPDDAECFQEVSFGRCWLCQYWPEPPPNATVVSVDREAGVITFAV